MLSLWRGSFPSFQQFLCISASVKALPTTWGVLWRSPKLALWVALSSPLLGPVNSTLSKETAKLHLNLPVLIPPPPSPQCCSLDTFSCVPSQGSLSCTAYCSLSKKQCYLYCVLFFNCLRWNWIWLLSLHLGWKWSFCCNSSFLENTALFLCWAWTLEDARIGASAVILPLQRAWAQSQHSREQSQGMERNRVLVMLSEPWIKPARWVGGGEGKSLWSGQVGPEFYSIWSEWVLSDLLSYLKVHMNTSICHFKLGQRLKKASYIKVLVILYTVGAQ